MPPKRALTLDQFKKAEEARQTHAGFAVPNPISQPHAAAVWSSEAQRRFNISTGGDAVATDKEIDSADVASALLAVAAWNPEPATRIATKFPPQDELLASIQTIESLLALHFYNPADRSIAKTLLKMKLNVEQYRSMGILGNAPGKNPHINFLYEIFCFRRLVMNWRVLTEGNRQESLTTALMLFRQFDNIEHRTAGDMVARAITEGLSDPVAMLQALDAACQHTQLTFKKTLGIVRAVHGPHAKDPHASIIYDKGGNKELVNDEASSKSADEIENIDSTDDDDNNHLVKDFISSRGQPPSKKARVDLVTGGTAAVPPKAPVAPKQVASKAPVTVVTTSSAASTHKYPCRSKYHAKYSSAEKHGSPECCFCCVCHMMEFLFNGCGRDCVWIHKPTARKIAVHLKSFSAVFQLAKKRLDDMAVGSAVPPVDIPL